MEPGPPVLRREVCALAAVRRVAAMLGADPDRFAEGDALPRGWHVFLLGGDTPRAALRADGFPGFGVPVPDLGLPRLMIVGRTVRCDAEIRIGAPLSRVSRIARLERKDGPRGPRALLAVEHALRPEGASEPALTETQTFLLLGEAAAGARTPAEPLPPPAGARVVVPDETLLFQYSALGFNSHRIHLDRDFARAEGFADLVVNGGLTTLLLTEHLRTAHGAGFRFLQARYLAPLLCGRPVTLGAAPRDGGWILNALDDEGRLAVEAETET